MHKIIEIEIFKCRKPVHQYILAKLCHSNQNDDRFRQNVDDIYNLQVHEQQ